MELREYFKKDRYAVISGIVLDEVRDGYARTSMPIEPDKHFNSVGIVQGGAIFTLADLAFAAASNSHGTVALGINVSISYLKAVDSTDRELIAEANELSCNRRLATYSVSVRNRAGELVATFQGMVYRKEKPLPLEGPA